MAPRLTIVSRAGAGLGSVQVGYPIPHEQVNHLIVHHDVIAFDPYAPHIIEAAKAHSRALYASRPDLGGDWPYTWGLAPDYRDEDHTIIVEGRGWRRTGAHTEGHNSTGYGVVLFGNYQSMAPTRGQTRGLRLLGRWLARPEEARSTLWHRQLKPTACPGNNGIAVAVFGQPPFTHADLSVFYPETPMPETLPTYNPPFTPQAPFVDSLDAPGGGAWALTEDGAVFTFGSARYFGGANGKAYFVGRQAARLRPHGDRYIIEARSGETYGHAGF